MIVAGAKIKTTGFDSDQNQYIPDLSKVNAMQNKPHIRVRLIKRFLVFI